MMNKKDFKSFMSKYRYYENFIYYKNDEKSEKIYDEWEEKQNDKELLFYYDCSPIETYLEKNIIYRMKRYKRLQRRNLHNRYLDNVIKATKGNFKQ